MSDRSRSTRRSRRHRDAISFARDQRARANEFAQAVWQIVRNRSCRNQKFRREYPIPPYTADFCCVALKLIVEVDGTFVRLIAPNDLCVTLDSEIIINFDLDHAMYFDRSDETFITRHNPGHDLATTE